MKDYYLSVDLRGNRRFPEAHSVQCVLEWDGEPDDLRPMAAEFYGVPLSQVGTPRETPLSELHRDAADSPLWGRNEASP